MIDDPEVVKLQLARMRKLRRRRMVRGLMVGAVIGMAVAGTIAGVRTIMKANEERQAIEAQQQERRRAEEAERQAKQQAEEAERKAKQAEEERRMKIEEEKRQAEELARKSVEEQKRVAATKWAELAAKREAEWPERRAKLAGKKLVALTFDDGPGAGTTPQLLDVLREKKVRATFFALGVKMRQHPEIVRRELVEGHEVEGHTMYHNDLGRMGMAGVRADIGEADEWFLRVVGRVPTLIRPPYGSVSAVLRQAVGVRPLLMWSVDTLDWKYRNSAEVQRRAMAGVHDGAVILMHDIHPTTVGAVAGLIDLLRGAGYEMVTVRELAAVRGVAMQGGVSYSNF